MENNSEKDGLDHYEILLAAFGSERDLAQVVNAAIRECGAKPLGGIGSFHSAFMQAIMCKGCEKCRFR